jgi:hypothetical protein
MSEITVTVDPSAINHIKYNYEVDNIFLDFPSKQKLFTFVNGGSPARTVKAGTLVGITTADQTIAKEVAAASTDGSQVPVGIVLYDIVIGAGASTEAEGLVGLNGSIFEDKVVLSGSETLDTVITGTGISAGQSIRMALLNANANIKLEPAATNISGYKDADLT